MTVGASPSLFQLRFRDCDTAWGIFLVNALLVCNPATNQEGPEQALQTKCVRLGRIGNGGSIYPQQRLSCKHHRNVPKQV